MKPIDIARALGSSLKAKIEAYEAELVELRKKELSESNSTEKEMPKAKTSDPREFGSALAKSIKKYMEKAEGGAIEAGEVSAEGAGKGIPGSGEKATGAVKKDELGAIQAGQKDGEGAGKGIPGSGEVATKAVKKGDFGMTDGGKQAQTPPAPQTPAPKKSAASVRGMAVKSEMGAIEAGEVSAEGAGKGIPGSGDDAGEVKKDEIPMDPKASWKPCPGCGHKMNPVEAVMAAKGPCGRCKKGMAKQEMMIDLKNQSDPEKRIKEVDPVEGRVLPGDKKPKKVSAEGSGGEIKKDEMSIPKAPKPPQAAGAKPSLHKGALSGMADAPKDMQSHAAVAAYNDAPKAPAAAPEPKAVPKAPDAYDPAAFTPAPSAPSGLELAAPVKSPVQHHLQKLGRGMGKSEMNGVCKKCGNPMAKAHKC